MIELAGAALVLAVAGVLWSQRWRLRRIIVGRVVTIEFEPRPPEPEEFGLPDGQRQLPR